MSELFEFSKDKLDLELNSITEGLSKRIQVIYRERAAKQMFKSGATIKSVLKECQIAYDQASEKIQTQIRWFCEQSLYLRAGSADELITFSLTQLHSIDSAIWNHLETTLVKVGKEELSNLIKTDLSKSIKSAEQAIALAVRQQRIEKPRNLLKRALSPIWSVIKGALPKP